MTWPGTPDTWTDGTVPDAADLNKVRDALDASEAAVVTTAGDMVAGDGSANSVARLGIGASGTKLRMNAGGTAPEWDGSGAKAGLWDWAIGSLTNQATSTSWATWDAGVELNGYTGTMTVTALAFGRIADNGDGTDGNTHQVKLELSSDGGSTWTAAHTLHITLNPTDVPSGHDENRAGVALAATWEDQTCTAAPQVRVRVYSEQSDSNQWEGGHLQVLGWST